MHRETTPAREDELHVRALRSDDPVGRPLQPRPAAVVGEDRARVELVEVVVTCIGPEEEPGGSVRGERANLTRLVLGCIEASKQASKVVQSLSKKRK